jgi:hypothetical protein
MHAGPRDHDGSGRRIQVRLTPRSLAPRVLPALRSLGYELAEASDGDDFDALAIDRDEFWLVDEARFDEVPGPRLARDARILLISSPRPFAQDDPRIVAQAPRPARLSTVYAMIQRAIESRPRRTPRIRTQLSARCIRSDRRSLGAVLSLSEGGCLLRTDDRLRKGSRVDLQFALPDYGLVSTPARCRYTRRGTAGLEFTPPPDTRLTIAHFVTQQLAAAASPAGAV